MTYLKPILAASALTLALATPAHANHHGGQKHMKNKDHASLSQAEMPMGKRLDDARAVFTAMDTDNSGMVNFTEFYDMAERRGLDTQAAAIMFSKITNGESEFNADSFAASGQLNVLTKPQKSSQSSAKIAVDGIAMTSGGADMNTTIVGRLNTDFANYDLNNNGSVDFGEFWIKAKSLGVTQTRAASEFIRISDGQASFDQSRYQNAIQTDSFDRQVYKASYTDPTMVYNKTPSEMVIVQNDGLTVIGAPAQDLDAAVTDNSYVDLTEDTVN